MADPAPIAFGLFAFVLIVLGVRFVHVTSSTITGPTSAALNYAILVAAIGQTLGGVLTLLRGLAFTGWVTTIFGVYLFGFYLLLTSTDSAAAHDTGIVTSVGGKPLPDAVESALQTSNVTAWRAESVAWYVLVMLVPVAILAIKPLRDRNIPYAIAFLAVIALLLTLGLGLHDGSLRRCDRRALDVRPARLSPTRCRGALRTSEAPAWSGVDVSRPGHVGPRGPKAQMLDWTPARSWRAMTMRWTWLVPS